jgi:hypothetical protein
MLPQPLDINAFIVSTVAIIQIEGICIQTDIVNSILVIVASTHVNNLNYAGSSVLICVDDMAGLVEVALAFICCEFDASLFIVYAQLFARCYRFHSFQGLSPTRR